MLLPSLIEFKESCIEKIKFLIIKRENELGLIEQEFQIKFVKDNNKIRFEGNNDIKVLVFNQLSQLLNEWYQQEVLYENINEKLSEIILELIGKRYSSNKNIIFESEVIEAFSSNNKDTNLKLYGCTKDVKKEKEYIERNIIPTSSEPTCSYKEILKNLYLITPNISSYSILNENIDSFTLHSINQREWDISNKIISKILQSLNDIDSVPSIDLKPLKQSIPLTQQLPIPFDTVFFGYIKHCLEPKWIEKLKSNSIINVKKEGTIFINEPISMELYENIKSDINDLKKFNYSTVISLKEFKEPYNIDWSTLFDKDVYIYYDNGFIKIESTSNEIKELMKTQVINKLKVQKFQFKFDDEHEIRYLFKKNIDKQFSNVKKESRQELSIETNDETLLLSFKYKINQLLNEFSVKLLNLKDDVYPETIDKTRLLSDYLIGVKERIVKFQNTTDLYIKIPKIDLSKIILFGNNQQVAKVENEIIQFKKSIYKQSVYEISDKFIAKELDHKILELKENANQVNVYMVYDQLQITLSGDPKNVQVILNILKSETGFIQDRLITKSITIDKITKSLLYSFNYISELQKMNNVIIDECIENNHQHQNNYYSLKNGKRIKFQFGNITKQNVNAIVNPANSDLLNFGGAACAIERAAGTTFKKACYDYIKLNGPIQVGKAVGSHSFKLNPNTFIINAVGPNLYITNQKSNKESLLESTIKNCLDQCKILNVNSIAIPAISSGIFGYKIEESSPIFIKTIVNYLLNTTDTCLNEVWFIDIEQKTIDSLENQLISYSTDEDSNVFLPFKKGKQTFSLSIRGFQESLIKFESSLKELINKYKFNLTIKDVTLSTFEYEKVYSMSNLLGVELVKHDSSIELNGIKEKVLEIQSKISSFQIKDNYIIDYPAGWDKTKERQLIKVENNSKEWLQVYDMVKLTLPKVKLVSVEIVQNQSSFQDYHFTKKQFQSKLNGDSGEMLLFHGTKSNDPTSVCYSTSGIDYRLGNDGCMWGKGSYFAVDASYSNGYASTKVVNGVQCKQFFIVKVLIGHSITLPPNNAIKLPPLKPNSLYERYDSVNGNGIYIIYDNKQSYAYYLVTYIGQ